MIGLLLLVAHMSADAPVLVERHQPEPPGLFPDLEPDPVDDGCMCLKWKQVDGGYVCEVKACRQRNPTRRGGK